ncbi:MAG TPA: transglycosylase SLT domain-containing protein [Longimicrobiales bacterium]|nr:transglycosylase SLT domain-containing protein [Longimicrobiales bacterium]
MNRFARSPTPTHALAAALLAALASGACAGDREADPVRGDVGEVVEDLGDAEMASRALAYLASDRPWSAARVMRDYAASVDELPPDRRVLAGRAEAGWGAWDRARDLLEGVPSLETYDGGLGVFLLGRAREETGDAAGAIEAYRRFLALPFTAGTLEEERDAAELRLALALLRTGRRAAADSALAPLYEGAGNAATWLDILRARALAEAGDTASVRTLVEGLDDGMAGLFAWRVRIDAASGARDTAEARAIANRARAWARTDGTRAEFLVRAAEFAIAMGDIGRGRDALRGAIDRAPGSPWARRAAVLLGAGDPGPADRLAIARSLRAQGLNEESLEGFRAWLASGAGSAGQREAVRIEYATALFYAQRFDEALEALDPVRGSNIARYLRARAAARAGDPAQAARLYLALAGEARGASGAARATYLAADTHLDAGERERARELYERVVTRYPGTESMGLSLMRLAGMAFLDGDYGRAARLWDDYRRRYPRGDRALQATYWAARARQEAGDSAAAAPLLREVEEADRDSYYALVASARLGEPFWPIPLAPAPDTAAASRVAGWVRGLDMLRSAGFHDLASEEALRLAWAVGTDTADRYAMGEALAERGYSRAAIRLGLALQEGEEPNERLLRILYPFPFRRMITEEARDRGIDPFVAAALMRQESLFDPRATSYVGARGLMQLMPATGAAIAEQAGVEPWDAELLYHPEINVYLGTRLLAQHMEDYGGSLPAVFSAYNAGPHRVDWWSAFPEFGNDELFTERIPFAETRGYVKILTRNRALYAGLYGGGEQGGTDAAAPRPASRTEQ